MGPIYFTRKEFMALGMGAVLAIAGDGLVRAARRITSEATPPAGFTFAAGDAPPEAPIKRLAGRIAEIDADTITVLPDFGGPIETVPLSTRPFIWQDGIVWSERAAERLSTGDRVVISGPSDSSGQFVDIQHVWVHGREYLEVA